MKEILSLKVTLNATNPAIFRIVHVPSSVTFFDLHHILQISMGWKTSHLFEFIVGIHRIGYVNPVQAFEDLVDANEVTLNLLLPDQGLVFTYLYDFGDGWEHTVEIENLIEREPGKIYPVCVRGQLRCPPEDSGGVVGYYEKLGVLKDKNHPNHELIKNWMGPGYKPEEFDLEKVNAELPNFKSYMKHWD